MLGHMLVGGVDGDIAGAAEESSVLAADGENGVLLMIQRHQSFGEGEQGKVSFLVKISVQTTTKYMPNKSDFRVPHLTVRVVMTLCRNGEWGGDDDSGHRLLEGTSH